MSCDNISTVRPTIGRYRIGWPGVDVFCGKYSRKRPRNHVLRGVLIDLMICFAIGGLCKGGAW